VSRPSAIVGTVVLLIVGAVFGYGVVGWILASLVVGAIVLGVVRGVRQVRA
jgi:hypothetical protein